MDNISRGCEDPDLDNVTRAAQKAAQFEEESVYAGYDDGCIRGLVATSPHDAVQLSGKAEALAGEVEKAVLTLQRASIEGPYDLVLDNPTYALLEAGTGQGYPLKRRVLEITGGSVHWSPAVKTGVLLSRRGGDFVLTVGQDFSVGFEQDEGQTLHLYLTESFTFRVLEPAAAVALKKG
jgi:uncharacterized linocin/CFP29 family protein